MKKSHFCELKCECESECEREKVVSEIVEDSQEYDTCSKIPHKELII